MKKEHPNSELLQSQTTTGNQNTNSKEFNTNITDTERASELIEREQVNEDGLEIIGNKERGYFAAIGQYRISKVKETKEEVREMIEQHSYEIIMGLIGASIETVIPRIENIIHNIIELKQQS